MNKNTKCIICNEDTEYYFTKQYSYPFNEFLKKADFHKCKHCGFTFSNTVFNMSTKTWTKLNIDFHSYIENLSNDKIINQPPYLEQALMIKILSDNKIIESKDMLDYAGGLGTLSKILNKYFNINLPIFDPYMNDDIDSVASYVSEDKLTHSKVVINSAMLEHIRNREHLEKLNSIVADDGILIIHTVICENIPKNRDWFYITPPVHSALHTNKSMSILMKQWGYVSSVYCLSSKSWILFKREPIKLPFVIEKINKELQTQYFIYKNKFVNYWS